MATKKKSSKKKASSKKKTASKKKTSQSESLGSLRAALVELLNNLHRLSRQAEELETKLTIRKQRRVLNALLDEVIEQEINHNTRDYKTALTDLNAADKAAKDAIVDQEKVASALEDIVQAAKAVDKVVELFGDIM